MTRIEFFTVIKDIVNEAKELQELHLPHADVQLDVVNIFPTDEDEQELFANTLSQAGSLLEEFSNKSIFLIKTPYPTKLGMLSYVALLRPEVIQKKRGMVELRVPDFEVVEEGFGFKFNRIGQPITHTLELIDQGSMINLQILRNPFSAARR